MIRKVSVLTLFALAGVLLVSGCSKKAPSTPASGGVSETSAAGGATDESGASETAATGLDAGALSTVYFGYDEYTLREQDRNKLKGASDALKKAGAKITVEGHCDERGSSEYNLALGDRRAQSVKSYLLKLGVPGDNLATISYGKERPADPGHSEPAWAKNRRGELITNR